MAPAARCSPGGVWIGVTSSPDTRSASIRARRLLARFAALALAVVGACGPGGSLRDQLEPRPPREAYLRALGEAGLDRSAVGRDWIAVGARALAAPAAATLPLREQGAFTATDPAAVAWLVEPRRGQRLVDRVEAQADSGTRLFSELFALAADTAVGPRLVASEDSLGATFTIDADDEDARYLLRLQPELLRAVQWTVSFEAGP